MFAHCCRDGEIVKTWKKLFSAILVAIPLVLSVVGLVQSRSRADAAQERYEQSSKTVDLTLRAWGEQRRQYVVAQAQQQMELLALLDAQDLSSARRRLITLLQDSEKELLRHDPTGRQTRRRPRLRTSNTECPNT